MKADEQLEWEARAGKPAALFAVLAAVLMLAGFIMRLTAFSGGQDNDKEILLSVNDKSSALLFSSVFLMLSLLAMIGVFYYLIRCIRARRDDFQGWILPLAIAGPILFGLAGILTTLNEIDIADTFVKSGAETVKRAEDLRDDTDVLATALGSGGSFALALSFVLVSMNAIRAGLMTRFTGIVGVIIGALYVLPFLPVYVIEFLWLLVIALLFLGHWPGGRGPAWSTVQSIAWPSGFARPSEDAVAQSIPPEPELESGDGNGDGSAPKAPNRRKSKKRKRR